MVNLPPFYPNQQQKKWIQNERETADFIKGLWDAASKKQRRERKFIWLLTQLGWMTKSPFGGNSRSITINWRNKKISEYLTDKDDFDSANDLQRQLCDAFPKLRLSPNFLRDTYTGITHCYGAHRGAVNILLQNKLKNIIKAFETAASNSRKTDHKIREVMEILQNLGSVTIKGKRNKKLSPLNGFTPVLACLDPNKKFPIINGQTASLLTAIGATSDANGAITISHLIGKQNIKDSFDLDVYTASHFDAIKKNSQKSRTYKRRAAKARKLKEKQETDIFVKTPAEKRKIERAHNKLTNAFLMVIKRQWKWEIEESMYDALIRKWKDDHHLLIEAKTESDGTLGRIQIRQAIGQLFDYRLCLLDEYETPLDKIDLAILLPQKPKKDVYSLLESLTPKIGILWFEGEKLKGTSSLETLWNS